MSAPNLYRTTAGLICVIALAVQYILLVKLFNGDFGAALLRFLNYFTLLSNILGAAAFLFPTIAPGTSSARFFMKPPVRTAVTLYLVVVGVVYHAILAKLWNPQGWQLATDVALHTVMPPAILIDWLFLTPKRDLSIAYVPRAILFPLGFALWAMALGAVNGFYPYPFLDVTALGYPRVLLNLAILLALFAVLGALMAALGRRLAASAAARK